MAGAAKPARGAAGRSRRGVRTAGAHGFLDGGCRLVSARVAWIAAIGAALFAHIAAGAVEFIVNPVTASWSAAATAAYDPLGTCITFPAVVLIGYFAARFRPGAARVPAALMVQSVTAMTLWATQSMPSWYRIAYLPGGAAAICIGSALSSRRRSDAAAPPLEGGRMNAHRCRDIARRSSDTAFGSPRQPCNDAVALRQYCVRSFRG